MTLPIYFVCVLFRKSWITVTNTAKTDCLKTAKVYFSRVAHHELVMSLLCLNLTSDTRSGSNHLELGALL